MTNTSLTLKYQRETLYWATKAYNQDRIRNYELAEEYYSKACRSISCAISFEKHSTTNSILSNLLSTYEQRLLQITEDRRSNHCKPDQTTVLANKKREQLQQQQQQPSTCAILSSHSQDTSVASFYYSDQEELEQLPYANSSNYSARAKNLSKRYDVDTSSQIDHSLEDIIEHEEYNIPIPTPSFMDLVVPESPVSSAPLTMEKDESHSFEDCLVPKSDNSKGFNDIVGLEEAIQCLKEAVILPRKHPKLFQGMRTPWKAILLYGPPGTGKTNLARALAHESNSSFFSISSADLLSKWMGESERMVRELFKKAERVKPSVIFIDEIDSLCSSRNDQESETARRVKTEFLVQMQGLDKTMNNVLVLAATNVPWELDSAIRRRFEKRIYIPLPDEQSRLILLKKHLLDVGSDLSEEDYHNLSLRLQGYSCSDIGIVCRSALMEPVRRLEQCCYFAPFGKTEEGIILYRPCHSNQEGAIQKTLSDFEAHEQIDYVPEVTKQDFEASLIKNKSSIDPGDLEKHEQFTRDFGQHC